MDILNSLPSQLVSETTGLTVYTKFWGTLEELDNSTPEIIEPEPATAPEIWSEVKPSFITQLYSVPSGTILPVIFEGLILSKTSPSQIVWVTSLMLGAGLMVNVTFTGDPVQSFVDGITS